MPIYICKRCSHETDRKSNIMNHVSRQNLCQNVNNVPEDLEEIYEIKQKERTKKSKICEMCKKEFNNSTNRKKHELTCKFNQLKDYSGPVQIINNNIIYNGPVINISLNSYKFPEIDDQLEKKIKTYLLSLKNTSVEKLIEKCYPHVFKLVYFNENVPENHSISMLDKKLLVCNGDGLELSSFDDIKFSLDGALSLCVDKFSSEIEEINDKFEDFYHARENSENIKNRIKHNYVSFKDQENEIIQKLISENSHMSLKTMKSVFNNKKIEE